MPTVFRLLLISSLATGSNGPGGILPASPVACPTIAQGGIRYEERINAIVAKANDAARTRLDGVEVLHFVPISTSDNDEIVAMGACSVLPLSRILGERSGFAQLDAVRLLAQLRTSEAIDALDEALQPDRWQPVRMSALYGLAKLEWNPETQSLIERIAHEDDDIHIRELAQSILSQKALSTE